MSQIQFHELIAGHDFFDIVREPLFFNAFHQPRESVIKRLARAPEIQEQVIGFFRYGYVFRSRH